MCASKRCEGLPVCRVKAVPSFLIHFKTLSIGLFPARTGLPRQEKKERKERETSAGLRSDSFPIWRFLNNQQPGDTAYRTGLRDNNCGLRNFQRAISTGHSHSTENETGFENQSVSDTNVVGGYMKVHVETGRGQPRPLGAFPWLWSALRTRLRQRSLSFPSFFFCRERTQLAGKSVRSQ